MATSAPIDANPLERSEHAKQREQGMMLGGAFIIMKKMKCLLKEQTAEWFDLRPISTITA